MANNLYFEVKADFLKTPLNAKVLKKDKLMMFLVEPEEVAEPKSIDIKDLIAKLKGDASNIGDAFDGNTDGVKICLSMVYLKYIKSINEETIPADGMEYALKLEVLDINTLPIFKKIGDIITVHKVTLAVWNTDDVAITGKMNLAIPAFTNKAIS